MNLWITLITGFLAVMAYLPTESGVIFNHKTHFVDRSISCAGCHSGVINSTSAQDKNIPSHDDCAECHSVENAPDDCRLCHTNPNEPSGIELKETELIFSHQQHLTGGELLEKCLTCHVGVDKQTGRLSSEHYPTMDRCFECHDGDKASSDCKVCHTRPVEVTQLVHPPDWKHSHRFDANASEKNCQPCHERETVCSDCHAGDNLVETVHDLNYRFNHGLDVKGKEFECQNCHDFETFCNDCHNQTGDRPFNHLFPEWSPRRNPAPHAEAARRDIESCASCHQDNNMTCSSPGGCHWDGDGFRGTDPNIHDASITDLGEGPWHDDPTYQCYQCHTNPGRAGAGFCGYCHGAEGE